MKDIVLAGDAVRTAEDIAARRWRPLASWVTDDTYDVNIGQEDNGGVAEGALQDPDFPDTVGANEDWEGTINGYNVGDASGTFRAKIGDVTTDSFTLGPGEGVTFTISGTGPSEFTIEFQRGT